MACVGLQRRGGGIGKYVIGTNKMHTLFVNDLIMLFSTYFDHPSFHPRED